MFNWINKTMIPYLFREHDDDGHILHWIERQMTKDRHVRIGPPRLRQLRIKNGISLLTSTQTSITISEILNLILSVNVSKDISVTSLEITYLCTNYSYCEEVTQLSYGTSVFLLV